MSSQHLPSTRRKYRPIPQWRRPNPKSYRVLSTIYTVKKGDNLGQIAQNCYGTQGPKRENVNKIAKANHLKSEGQIHIGQKLIIPSPTVLSESKPSMFENVKTISKNLVDSEASQSPAEAEGYKRLCGKIRRLSVENRGKGTRQRNPV